jgi:hypothetical protein
MKKNIFKFTYIALAVVAMFAFGQRRAYAADCTADCINDCEVADTACVTAGNDTDSCQSADADCHDGCLGQCGIVPEL